MAKNFPSSGLPNQIKFIYQNILNQIKSNQIKSDQIRLETSKSTIPIHANQNKAGTSSRTNQPSELTPNIHRSNIQLRERYRTLEGRQKKLKGEPSGNQTNKRTNEHTQNRYTYIHTRSTKSTRKHLNLFITH